MKSFSLVIISVLFSFTFSKAQTTKKYKDIDTLINTYSMIDAMTALKKLKENYAKDTVDAEYWLRYSKANYTFYKYEDAKAGINRALKLNPGNANYHYEKGLLYNRIGQSDSALAPLEKAISIEVKGEYYFWKGIVNQQLKKNQAAEMDYTKAIENKFENAELYNNFCIILAENEKYEKALEIVNKSIALNRKFPQAYSARCKINFFLYNFEAACADRDTANNMGYKKTFTLPDSVCKGTETQKIQYLSDIFAFSGLYKSAIEAYSKLINNNVLKPDYFLNRGYCYYKLKDYVNAEKDYATAEKSFSSAKVLDIPALDLLYDNLSLLYFDQNNFKKASDYSTKRIELNPRNHVPYIDRGLSYRKMKKYKEAEIDFNKSLEIKPDFFRAFGYRSYLFLELKQYQKAYDDAAKSVKLNPKYGYGYMMLGQSKQALGMKDFCIDFYTALKYDGPEAEEAIKQYCK